MRQLVPIARTFRRALVAFEAIPNKNFVLRRLLFMLRRLDCLLTCSGEAYSTTAEARTTLTFIRAPDPMSIKATIAHLGIDGTATIYQDGKIVSILNAGDKAELPLSGSFIIQAKADA